MSDGIFGKTFWFISQIRRKQHPHCIVYRLATDSCLCHNLTLAIAPASSSSADWFGHSRPLCLSFSRWIYENSDLTSQRSSCLARTRALWTRVWVGFTVPASAGEVEEGGSTGSTLLLSILSIPLGSLPTTPSMFYLVWNPLSHLVWTCCEKVQPN